MVPERPERGEARCDFAGHDRGRCLADAAHQLRRKPGEFFLLVPANVRHAQMNGIIYASSAVKPAYVTDGNSNTLLHGEWAHGKLWDGQNGTPDDQKNWHHWISGKYGDTMFSTYFPINFLDKPFLLLSDASDEAQALATNAHPASAHCRAFTPAGLTLPCATVR